MKVFTILLAFTSIITLYSSDVGIAVANLQQKNYSSTSFFVKTFAELKISEATGKVLLQTGITSLDNVIIEHGVTSIRPLFKVNNGNHDLFIKLGMNRIYLFESKDRDIVDIDKAVETVTSSGDVEFSEFNFIGHSAGVKEIVTKKEATDEIPSDEMFYKQWYLMNTGYVNSSGGSSPKIGADINMLRAWEVESGSDSIVVAILDSGIKDDHPDIRQRMWINKDEIPGNDIDDDFNGYVDDIKGWDFAYDDRKASDGFGHGTNIATVIGASTDNKIGFAGVDRNCKLMNCKNLNADNSGEYSWWSESIKYAVDNGAHIINMSEGGEDPSRILKTAIQYALESDVMVVAAMMNKGDNKDYFPAVYDGVFAVGATDTDDRRCKRFSWGGGSCWGNHIAVVAPGNKIYGLDFEDDDNYEVYWSGTSQSTAIVSGLAALLLAQDRGRTYLDLQQIIRLSSKDLVGDPREDQPGWDPYYGYGRVDGYSALTFGKDPGELFEMQEKKVEKEEKEEKQEVKKETERQPGDFEYDEQTKSKIPQPSKPK